MVKCSELDPSSWLQSLTVTQSLFIFNWVGLIVFQLDFIYLACMHLEWVGAPREVRGHVSGVSSLFLPHESWESTSSQPALLMVALSR